MKKIMIAAAAFAAGTVTGGAFVAAGLDKKVQKIISEKLSELKDKKKDEDEPEPAEASAESENDKKD